jgi:hypothetical protein
MSNAYLWSAKDGVVDLGLIDGQSTSATDINDAEFATVITGVGIEGFVWHKGQFTEISAPDNATVFLHAINNRNEVLGSFQTPSPKPPFQTSAGFLWHDGQIHFFDPLPGDTMAGGSGISNNSIVAGNSGFYVVNPPSFVWHPFVWQGGVTRPIAELLPPVVDVRFELATSISDTGLILMTGNTIPQGSIVAIVLEPAIVLAGDSNCDKVVNIDDLLNVINAWGPCNACAADFGQDGLVNIADLFVVIENWTFAR